MNDIFSRNSSQLGGVFAADQAKLTLLGGTIMLVQRLNMSYSQMVTRLWEVGGPNIYYVVGRTQGQMGLDRVIGPTGTIKDFYNTFGNACNARSNTLSFSLQQTDCSADENTDEAGTGISASAGKASYTLQNCVITQVAVGVAAQDMIISENTTLLFSSLSIQ
jgi:hypothetical protein